MTGLDERSPRCGSLDSPSFDETLMATLSGVNAPAAAKLAIEPGGRPVPLALLAFAISLTLVFSISIRRKVDVDEHAFIAAGATLLRDHRLPYRDYHYNHMPTQPIVYSLLFRLSDRLVLTARLFQGICAAGLVTAITLLAYHQFTALGNRGRTFMAGAFGLLMLCHPLFTRTAGLSWNHDFPMLACLGAYLALRHGVARDHVGWLLLAGFLAGLAGTARLTYLPALLGFTLLVLLYPGLSAGRRALLLLEAGIGFGVACLPAAWIWAQSPANAFFGNLLYPRLNTAYHAARDSHQRFTALPIFLYYLQIWFTLPGNGVVSLAFFWAMGTTLRLSRVRTEPLHAELYCLLIVIVCLAGTGFMPAPPYPQYFYAPTPFMVVALMFCLASRPQLLASPGFRQLAAAGMALTVGFALPQYRGVVLLPRVSQWTPTRAHAIGQEIARKTQPGKVLTLELTYPLEGGRDVYPEVATSRFGLRVAQLLSPAQRQEYVMPMPMELDKLFQTDPPTGAAVVLGADDGLDRLVMKYAAKHGYVPVPVSQGTLLRKPPEGAGTSR